MGFEPKLHLLQHMLVDLSECIGILLALRLLLIQYLVRKFREVLRLDLFHDEIEGTRRHEFRRRARKTR